MKIRSVLLASVCSVLLAASAAAPAVSATAEKSPAAIASESAYKALVSGKSLAAIKLYAEAIESRTLSPDLLANSLLNRALAFQNVGQHQEAIDDYSTALRIDVLSPQLRSVALYNRGLSNHKMSNPSMAIEDFTSALFLDVEFSQAYYSRGNVLRRSGQLLFALSDYEKALKYSHPEPHLPLYGTALAYESLRRPQEAQDALVKALSLKPDFVAARELLTALIEPSVEPGTGKPAAQSDGGRKVAEISVPTTSPYSDDAIVTGSVVGSDPDLVMRKEGLPEAVSPPSSVQEIIKVVPASVEVVPQASSQTTNELQAPAIPDLPAIETMQNNQEIKPAATTAEPVQVAAVEPTQVAVVETALPDAKPVPSGWAVQLSSQKKETAAWSAWKKMQAKHGRLLKSHEARVVRADLGDRGIFFRLRVTGIGDKRTASKLCKRLKKRGTSCYVTRITG